MGADARRWNTVQFERTVLVVARTLTSTVWGLDFLDEVLADPRVQIVFTVEDQSPSAFHRGASDLLEMVEAPVISWAQAVSRRFDLAICSSHRGSLTQLNAPLLIGLHGAGIGKPSALPDAGLLRRTPTTAIGEAPALTTAIAHSEQTPYFAHPEAPQRPRSVDVQVVGDPLLDRLAASEMLREQYRSELGLRDDQLLIVLSSTWGRHSLMSNCSELATRLTAELPADHYRVAFVLHPNIWIGHGGWQVRAWLRRERAAGVLIVPPWRNAWRSCVVASDAVIHDHGSVGLYAAALGRPTLHVVHDTGDMLAGSAIAELTRLSPRLRLDRPLLPQVSGAIDEYQADQYRDATSRVSGAPGQALALHRDLIYRLLRLDPPPWPARVLAVDPPPEQMPLIHSHQVVTDARADGTVGVQRFPAVTPPPPPPRYEHSFVSRHLVSAVSEPNVALSRSAAIVVGKSPALSGQQLLARFPGCALVVEPWSTPAATVHWRGGESFALQPASSNRANDPAVAASALYGLVTAGHPVGADLRLNVELSGSRQTWLVRRDGIRPAMPR